MQSTRLFRAKSNYVIFGEIVPKLEITYSITIQGVTDYGIENGTFKCTILSLHFVKAELSEVYINTV